MPSLFAASFNPGALRNRGAHTELACSYYSLPLRARGGCPCFGRCVECLMLHRYRIVHINL